jgi:hypothetical protein
MRRLALLLAAAALAAANGCTKEEPELAGPGCATKRLYGKDHEIRVVGKPVSCDEVRRVIAGPCEDGKKWSCFSFRPPDPVLVWFLEKERFRPGPDNFSTAIEARRYPCGVAPRVTRERWRRATRKFAVEGFPTRQQVLADDLVRCKMLRGMTRQEVERLLGDDDGASGDRYLSYGIGPQRDSFFQIDDEFLSIEFDRRGIFRRADYSQG